MKDGRDNSSTRRPGARPLLFISYRRRFDAPSARLLKNELVKAFGEDAVFRDVDDIKPGEAFPETIREAVESCDAFLPLISPGWLGVVGELQDPDDFVRREIAAALARKVPLIPVLLGGARMPEPEDLPEEIRELASRHAIELSDDRWDYDVARLIKLVRTRAALSNPPSLFRRIADALRSFLGTRPGKATCALLVALPLAAAAYSFYRERPEAGPPNRPVSYGECLDRLRVPGTLETKVRAQEKTPAGEPEGEVIVGVDQYRLTQPPPPDGLPLLIRITGSGSEVGAVSLRFLRGDYPKGGVAFKVLKVVEPTCREVMDYSNKDSKAKSEVYNWDGLSLRLGHRDYRLRLGDHGDSILATLTLDEKR